MERVNRRRKLWPAILHIYFLIIQDSNWPRLRISAAGALATSRDVRFSNRPTEVKRFQTIRRHAVDVARGLALLFGIGTTALPSWDSRIRWDNLYRGLAVPHPSSREGPHSTVGKPRADGRLPGQCLARLAFAAVLGALEPSPASLRLDNNILDRRFVDAVAPAAATLMLLRMG